MNRILIEKKRSIEKWNRRQDYDGMLQTISHDPKLDPNKYNSCFINKAAIEKA